MLLLTDQLDYVLSDQFYFAQLLLVFFHIHLPPGVKPIHKQLLNHHVLY